ncbi:type II CAAX endopeptidase family protein [Amnibacterium sp.]|uniref:type II CAAX endopeptidase family protein n=1 Tax=Amnibacterium sp. TaxID=1872496 RepID=UPI00261E345B|nr:type II CAAX endopeptidase family protein [Amnibacterium sp.]
MSMRTLRTFFLATFVLSWSVGVLLSVFPTQAAGLFGPMSNTNPAFILIVYTPGIVAVVLVVWHYGFRGLGAYLRRFALWRMSWSWWLLLVIGMPAVVYAGAAVKGTLGDPFPFTPWFAVFPALIPALLIGPLEELGWRGVALPLLQRRFAPLWASLILGVVIALWHTPAFFFLSGTKQSTWALGPFFLGIVAISVILTGMFNASRGSLLVAFLFHAQVNGPAWPDVQPWDDYLFVAVAIVVVLVNRRTMLTRGAGATAVLFGHEAPQSPAFPARPDRPASLSPNGVGANPVEALHLPEPAP